MPPSRLARLAVPLEAQDAAYLAASARIASFRVRLSCMICSLYVRANHCHVKRQAAAFCDRQKRWSPPGDGLQSLIAPGRLRDRAEETQWPTGFAPVLLVGPILPPVG